MKYSVIRILGLSIFSTIVLSPCSYAMEDDTPSKTVGKLRGMVSIHEDDPLEEALILEAARIKNPEYNRSLFNMEYNLLEQQSTPANPSTHQTLANTVQTTEVGVVAGVKKQLGRTQKNIGKQPTPSDDGNGGPITVHTAPSKDGAESQALMNQVLLLDMIEKGLTN